MYRSEGLQTKERHSMIPKECKRLAEVDFPIAVVSKHSASDKYIRYKPTNALHTWWAQRPLSACRAMLLGLLLPDPCDPKCPTSFKKGARKVLESIVNPGETDEDLRRALLSFIGNYAAWENTLDRIYLQIGQDLVRATYKEGRPFVVDPFAGAGSIPLEALRVGCEVLASDLNPVACLILKTILEDVPRYDPSLADELEQIGEEIIQDAKKTLYEFYPKDSNGSKPIAYLWAKTVLCEAPNCGAEIPLINSFWLIKKSDRKLALKHKVIRTKDEPPQVEFEIFEPKNDRDVQDRNIYRAKATCLCCNTALTPERIRAQMIKQHGGNDVLFDAQGNRKSGARLLAVIFCKPIAKERYYRLPLKCDYDAIWKAQRLLAKKETEKTCDDLNLVPNEPTPSGGGSGAGRAFSVQQYGMMTFGDLFTARQKISLVVLSNLLRSKGCDRGCQ